MEQAYLLEKYNDYLRSAKVYLSILDHQKSAALKNTSWGQAIPFEVNDKCSAEGSASINNPSFLKSVTGKYLFSEAALTGYGLALIKQNRHEDALFPLCLAAEGLHSKKARDLLVLSILKTGLKKEITDGPYDLSNAELGKIDLSNMQLQEWNFSNTKGQITAENTNLDGAIFKDAKITGQLRNVSLKNAVLDNSSLRLSMEDVDMNGASLVRGEIVVRGSWKNINLENANLSESFISADDVLNVNFSKALLKKANFSPHFGAKNNKGLLFKNADLEEAKMPGLDLSNVDFGAASLKNADFSPDSRQSHRTSSSTNFAGSNLALSNIEGTTFDGATYDCRTKFPINFNADAYLTMKQSSSSASLDEKPSYDIEKEKEKETRHKEQPYKGIILSKDSNLNVGTNLNGARLTADTELPENFDSTKYKQIPRAVINQNRSAWEFSKIGRTAGTCGDPINYDSYKAPDIPIPDLKGADLSFGKFNASWLPKVDMRQAQLMYSDFSSSNFMHADFSNANMEGIDLFNSIADGANFSNAILRKADLRMVRLTNAKFDKADLKGAIYDKSTLWPAGFDPVAAGLRREALRAPAGIVNRIMSNEDPKLINFKVSNLPKETLIFGVGAYGSSTSEKQVTVKIENKSAPVLIVLNTSKDSKIKWNIKQMADTHIVAVIMTQGEIGEIPQALKIYDYRGVAGVLFSHERCGRAFDAYQDFIKSIIGKGFSLYKGAKDFSSYDDNESIYIF